MSADELAEQSEDIKRAIRERGYVYAGSWTETCAGGYEAGVEYRRKAKSTTYRKTAVGATRQEAVEALVRRFK